MENCVSSAALDAARTRLDAAEAARETILLQHIANGVIIDSRTVQIAPDVQIAPGAVILAGTILRGHTIIGAGCTMNQILVCLALSVYCLSFPPNYLVCLP